MEYGWVGKGLLMSASHLPSHAQSGVTVYRKGMDDEPEMYVLFGWPVRRLPSNPVCLSHDNTPNLSNLSDAHRNIVPYG